ncbi:MAG: hypothetical protein ACK5X6_06910 [Chryseotalea sp.]
MILDKDKEIDKKGNLVDGKQVEKKQPEQEEKPKQTEVTDEENPYGGLPNRNLKNNLGCG